jgi:hypothetical protein
MNYSNFGLHKAFRAFQYHVSKFASRKTLLLFAVPCALLTACISRHYVTIPESIPTSKNQNVCGLLKDSVVLYAVFVDVGLYHPFSDYDVASTLDSIQKAMDWIQSQPDAQKRGLRIEVVQHIDGSKISFPERKAKVSPLKLVNMASTKKRHKGFYGNWIDGISKYVGRKIKKTGQSKAGTRNRKKTTERVVAALRDKYKTDNVAYMVFLNGYYENDPSYTFNASTSGPDVEYSIISNKNPAVIAHEFMHLFGAVDLYPTARFANFNFEELRESYPNEIMLVQHKEITKLKISPITKYFLGWQTTLDHKNTRMLLHKLELPEY